MTTNTWNLDTVHSAVGFSVRHLVFAKVGDASAPGAGRCN
jgi:polyisoprenoid-binding protein YceI